MLRCPGLTTSSRPGYPHLLGHDCFANHSRLETNLGWVPGHIFRTMTLHSQVRAPLWVSFISAISPHPLGSCQGLLHVYTARQCVTLGQCPLLPIMRVRLHQTRPSGHYGLGRCLLVPHRLLFLDMAPALRSLRVGIPPVCTCIGLANPIYGDKRVSALCPGPPSSQTPSPAQSLGLALQEGQDTVTHNVSPLLSPGEAMAH